MGIKTISELDIAGRRLFIRVDFNVPLTPDGKVSDDTRIRESLPTIKLAIEKGARVVLASHLGRPKGKVDKKYTLEPVAERLAELLDADVALTDEPVGDGARKVVNDLRAGAVALLENLRFSPGEEANDEAFSRALASYADVYVNDAFGTAHRAHASTVGMTKFVAAKGMGLLMEREVKFLGKLLGDVERPFVAIIGGAKVSDKIGVLDNLLERVDQMLIGGAMANTFLKAKGGQLGRSLVEADKLPLARSFLKKAEEGNVDVLLPRDVVAAAGIKAESGRVVQAMMVPEDLAALDIGPETARGFADGIARAKTIFWNGPMGVFESAPFAGGTMAVAKAVAGAEGALSVVGGGDSVAAIHKSGLADKITHISTGGGASLEFLEGKKLPGLAALEQG
ncbi:MAG TPA: phosphoglycerate kinase [Polyangia bacterium]|jgi:phosphoglycerate kinase|nr:phosphoglycerate kinase [Polyangia bacterium]